MYTIASMGIAGGPSKINLEVVELIRRAIADKGIKNSDIYLGIGRSRSWWHKVMQNKQNITTWELVEIAGLLGVAPGALLPGKHTGSSPSELDECIEKKVLEILKKHENK